MNGPVPDGQRLNVGHLAARIARFAAEFDSQDLTDELYRAVARSVLDTHAVAVAGWDEPATRGVRKYVMASGVPFRQYTGQVAMGARLWGEPNVLPPEFAALLNGVAAHVLDYDDVSSPMRGHPSVALWPALLALAESRDSSGARLCSAFAVGFEVIVKLSNGMAQPHYAKGWHSTSAIGTIGAAVACSHLLGLTVAEIGHAVGLAVAQTAGTRQNFGSDAKSFQAGNCNAAAVRAALLAEAGVTAGDGALGGHGGYVDLYGGQIDQVATELLTLGERQLELLRSGVEVKKYPMCYAAHRALDGILELQTGNSFDLTEVRHIQVTSSRGALTPLIHHRPKTGLEAKFSMEYGMAAALSDGHVSLSSFTDEAVARPSVQSLLTKVEAREEGEALFPRWTKVTVEMNSGVCVEKRVDVLRGSALQPLDDRELITKAEDCYRHSGSSLRATTVFQAACALRTTSARDFTAILSAEALPSTA